MALQFNQVILSGHLTRDPELRHTKSGIPVCSASLAVNEKFPTAEGGYKEDTLFVDLSIWDKRGEAFQEHFTKGKSVFVKGVLKLNKWEDRDGNKKQKLYVQVQDWRFVESKASEPTTQSSSYSDEPAF